MIENFDPSSALRAVATAVTAIIYTGDPRNPIELADLALGVETGEVIPLADPLFAIDGRGASRRTGGDEPLSLQDTAELLRCDPTAAAFGRVGSLVLLQAINEVTERRRQLAQAEADVATRTSPRTDPMSGSMEALLAAMNAAEAAHTE